MNYWTQRSIQIANEENYLDELFSVYPISIGEPRIIPLVKWKRFETAFYGEDNEAVKVAILDGVIYIKSKKKMYSAITGTHSELNVMSALVLRDFLYQI